MGLSVIKNLNVTSTLINFGVSPGVTNVSDIVSSTIFREVLLLFVAILTFYKMFKPGKHNKGFQDYKSIHGPKQLPIVGNALSVLPRRDFVKSLNKFGEMYRPCYRLKIMGEEHVVLCSPEYAQAILSSMDLQHTHKAVLYDALMDPRLKEFEYSMPIVGGEQWKSRRKTIHWSFTNNNLNDYIYHFNVCGSSLVKRFEDEFKNDSTPKPIYHHFVHLLTKVIADTVIGKDMMTDVHVKDFADAVEQYLDVMARRMVYPWLLNNFIFSLSHLATELKEISVISDRIGTDLINESRKRIQIRLQNGTFENSRPTSMVENLILAGVPDDSICEEIRVMLCVGQDTSGLTLQSTLFCLALFPEHQAKCFQEIDTMFKNPLKYTNGHVTLEGLADLEYVEQCMYEAMRMIPIPWWTGRRIRKPLKLPNGIEIPAGVNVMVSNMSVHTDPKHYPNPEKFDPSRFTPENIKNRHPFAYLAFSAGNRGCLGRKFAVMELKIILAMIIHKFEVSTVDRMEDVVYLPNMSASPETPMRFILKERSSLK